MINQLPRQPQQFTNFMVTFARLLCLPCSILRFPTLTSFVGRLNSKPAATYLQPSVADAQDTWTTGNASVMRLSGAFIQTWLKDIAASILHAASTEIVMALVTSSSKPFNSSAPG